MEVEKEAGGAGVDGGLELVVEGSEGGTEGERAGDRYDRGVGVEELGGGVEGRMVCGLSRSEEGSAMATGGRTVFGVFLCAAGLLLASPACLGEVCSVAAEVTGGEVTLTVYDYSPLREAVAWVRAKYGWPVSYEDPIYREDHVVDVAAAVWRRAHPGERGYYVPRPTMFTVRFPAPAEGTRDERKTLEAIVTRYNGSQSTVHAALVQGERARYTVYGEDAYPGRGGVAGRLIHISDSPVSLTMTEPGRILEACSQGVRLRLCLGR